MTCSTVKFDEKIIRVQGFIESGNSHVGIKFETSNKRMHALGFTQSYAIDDRLVKITGQPIQEVPGNIIGMRIGIIEGVEVDSLQLRIASESERKEAQAQWDDPKF